MAYSKADEWLQKEMQKEREKKKRTTQPTQRQATQPAAKRVGIGADDWLNSELERSGSKTRVGTPSFVERRKAAAQSEQKTQTQKPTAYQQWAAHNPAMAKAQEARSTVAKAVQETNRNAPAKKTSIVDDVANLIARDTESIDYKIADIERQMDAIDKERRTAYDAEVGYLRDGKWGYVEGAESATADLDRRYNELESERDTLVRNKEKNAKALKLHTYNALASLEDFGQFSAQGASIANPRAEKVYAGEKTRHASGIGAQYMQNAQNLDDVQNIVSFVRDDWDNLAPYMQEWIKSTGHDKYLKMTEDEVNTYNYLLAKEGKESADEYLGFIEETLNYREGTESGKEMMAEDNRLWRTVKNTAYTSLVAGPDKWASGAIQKLSSDRLPTNSRQFAYQYVSDNSEGIEKLFVDSGYVVGNMLPSILISKGTGLIGSALGWGAKTVGTASTIAGAAAVGTSASGNAYNQALGEGYTKEEARKYAALVGASEAGLSAVLGSNLVGGKVNGLMKARIQGIDNALGRIAGHWALSTGGEVTEEVLQEYLEPAFRSLIFDVDYDAPNFEDVAYVALLTALSASAPGAVDAVATETTNSRTGKSVKASEGGVKGLLDGALALDPSTESHKKATALMNKKGEPNDAEIGDLQRTFAIDSIKADKDRLKAETDKAKQFGEGSTASETATRIEEKLAKGKEVSDDDIAELLTDNAVAENDARSKQRAADADALVENAPAVEELVQQGRDLGGRASKEAERIASKVANGVEVTSNDIQRLMEVNENTKTAVDKYTKRVIDNAVARKITNYGEHGAQAFADAVNTSNGQDIRDVQLDFDTPYQAGLMNKNRNTVTLDSPLAKLAYNAGVQDYIAQRKVDKKHKAVVYTEEASTFDWTNAPTDITQEEKNLAEFIVKNMGVQGDFSSAEQAYNAFYDPDTGKTTFDAGFGISPELTKKLGNLDYLKKVEKLANERGQSFTFYLAHEIATHRAMDLAPREMRAFVSAMYEYKQGKTIGANLAREKTTNYALRGKDLDTYTAMEEVVADVILDLYDGDVQAFADAIYRIGNSTNESAKKGMQTYFKWLGDFIEKLKAWAQKLTGRENATIKANVEQSISEIENLRNMFEKAIGTSMKTVAKARAKGKAVSVAPQTTTESNIKESIKSFATAAGLTATKDANGRVSFTIGGEVVDKVTADHIKNHSGMGGLISTAVENGFISSSDAKAQYESMADIMNMIIKTQDPELVWAWAGSSMFSAIKSNSDGQYGTTVDFTTVCRKTQDMITAMSKAMMKLKRGLTKAEITDLQSKLLAEGSSVPCPVCYVFSRWAGVGSILDNMSKWQTKYENFTDKQIQERIAEMEDKFSKESEHRVKGNDLVATLRDLDEEYDQLNYEQESLAAERKRLQPKKRAAVRENDAHALSEINNRITEIDKRTKQIKERLKYIKDSVAPELSWLTQVRAAPDYVEHGRVPTNVLYNLDDAAQFSEKYPLAWKYRSTRGPGAGKAILPYSDMQLGDIILGVGKTSADGNKLFANANGEFTTDQKAAVDKAIARAKAQNLIGGQRFQSTSDFRYDYALDYLMAFLECQAIGSKMQTYTKIIEFGDMVAAVGGDFNLSVMPRNKGYITLPNGTNQLVFSSVTGISYEAAVRSSQMHDNGQLILVGINDAHILAALEDSEETRGANIGFVIPYHASGASINEFIRVLVSNLGETYMAKSYMDYSDVQTDKENGKATSAQKRRNDLRTKLLKGKDGAKNWEPTAEDLEFIRGESVDISNRSFEYLREIERNALLGDKKAIAEYESWTIGALRSLYEKLWSNESSEYHGVRLNSAQAKSVMPHEYWNKSVGRDKAYINGFLFRSYCYNLGLSPRFTGVGAKGGKHGDFSDSKGYWKLLIDRPMYNNDGTYRDQQRVNVTKLQKEMLTPSYAKTNWKGYAVQEPSADRASRAADRFVEGVNGGHSKNTKFSLRTKEPPKNTGIAYKVFYAKDGQLYPPMVANPGGAGTPVGVWLDADVGVAAAPSKTGRPQVQAGGKGTNASKGSLAFRPGWHLGDLPIATQFARKNPETGEKDLFPADFVWAECEYAMDVDYQEEAMSYGYTPNGKFRHSYAGLPKLPEDGYYRYRTNPNPDTVPWVITGAMKVNRILTDAETDAILRDAGVEPMKRQGGELNLERLGLKAGDTAARKNTTTESGVKYSLKTAKAKGFDLLVDEFFKNKLSTADPVYIGTVGTVTSELIGSEFPFIVTGAGLRKSTRKKGNNPSNSAHGMSEDFIRDLPQKMADPLFAVTEKRNGEESFSLYVWNDETEKLSVIAGSRNATYESEDVNRIRTIFDIGTPEWYLGNRNGQFVTTDKKRAEKFLAKSGIQSPKLQEFLDSMVEIIPQEEDSVKSKSSLKGEKETFDEIIRIREEGAKAGKSTSEIDQEVGAFVGQQYAELIKEYGAISKGEKASREIEVPKKSEEDRPVSQTVRTILEAEVTPDTLVPQLQEMVTTGEFSYDVFSDKSAMDGAKRTIRAKGYSEALADWYNAVDNGKVNKANTALGWELYNQAANAGNVASAINILTRMVGHQRNAAQALQATRILKKLTPDAQLYSAVKEAQKLEDDLMKKFPKFDGIKIDETLAEEFMQAETQEERDRIMKEIYRDIGRQMPASWIDKFNAWRYMAMLTNPRTHIRNVIGNAAFAPLVLAKDLTASAIESTVNFVAKTTTGKSIGRTKGRVKSDLLKAAWEDFANVQDIVKGGGNKYNETANANRYIEEGRRIYKTKPLEAVRKTNSNLLDLEDMWFSKPHYAYALAQYCSANGITAEQLKRGKALGNAREYAIREAQKATYRDTNYFSEMIGNIGRRRNANPAEKVVGGLMTGVLPFRKTPANILARGVEYSPLGVIKVGYDVYKVAKGDKTAAELIDSIASTLTGTGLIALGAFLAAQGLVRGAGGSDEEEKKFEELQGHQGYALELPDGTSVTLDWLAPEALPFFVGVNLYETTKEGKKGATAADLLTAITNISEPMLELSCLQSLNDVFDGLGYANANDTSPIVALIASATTSYLTQYVPTILGQAERSTQGNRMTTYTEKDNWLTSDMQYTLGKTSARIPGWDFGQIPYIDAWGREESTGNPVANTANNFLNPAYTSKVESSAMEKELARLYDRTGESKVLPQRADKYFTVDGERKDLTATEYVKYATEKGKLSRELVTDLTKSKAYKKMDDADKAEAVSKAYAYANESAKKKVDSDFDPQSWVSKAMTANKKLGLDETDYILYQTALASADPGEKETVSKVDAIRSVGGLSDAQKAFLFDGKLNDGAAYKAHQAGVDMDDYLTYKIAMESLTWQKGKTGAKKAAVTKLLKSLGLEKHEYNYLYHKENGYK